MINNLNPGQKLQEIYSEAQRSTVTNFLNGKGELVLDIANPVGRPSFDGIEDDLKEGYYVCVNPSNVSAEGSEGYQSQPVEYEENVLLTDGDGLLADSINEVVENADEHLDADIRPDNTMYMSHCGLAFMLKYCARPGVGSFENYHVGKDEDAKELIEQYTDNLSEMDIGHINLSFSPARNGDSFGMREGDFRPPNYMPQGLIERIDEDLREDDWNVKTWEATNRTKKPAFGGGTTESEISRWMIHAKR